MRRMNQQSHFCRTYNLNSIGHSRNATYEPGHRKHDGNENVARKYSSALLLLLCDYSNSLYNVAKLSSNGKGGKRVHIETKNGKFALVYSRSPQNLKVPINPKFIFRLNKSFYNSEQNGANKFVFGQNRNFL